MMIEQSETDKGRIGRLGEEAVMRWLRQHGFEICARNWRSGAYELDLVARKYDRLHFVEVKTRRADGLTSPEAALTPAKIRSLHRAARLYMGTYKSRYGNYEPQFDLAAVRVAADDTMQVDLIEEVAPFAW